MTKLHAGICYFNDFLVGNLMHSCDNRYHLIIIVPIPDPLVCIIYGIASDLILNYSVLSPEIIRKN